MAGALVLAGTGEAGVALGLDAQGGWACGRGGTEVTVIVSSDGDVSEPQVLLGAQPVLPRGCAPGNGTATTLLSHQGLCQQAGKRTEATWSPSSTRQLRR